MIIWERTSETETTITERFKTSINIYESQGYKEILSARGKKVNYSELAMYSGIAGGYIVRLWKNPLYFSCMAIVQDRKDQFSLTSGAFNEFADSVSIS